MRLSWIFVLIFVVENSECSEEKRVECCQYGRMVMEKSSLGIKMERKKVREICAITNIRKEVLVMKLEAGKSRMERMKTMGRMGKIERMCSLVARSCCMNAYRTKICRLGASEDVDCEAFMDQNDKILENQIRLECCLCCQTENSIPSDLFQNCNLLNGTCPQKKSGLVHSSKDLSSLRDSSSSLDSTVSFITRKSIPFSDTFSSMDSKTIHLLSTPPFRDLSSSIYSKTFRPTSASSPSIDSSKSLDSRTFQLSSTSLSRDYSSSTSSRTLQLSSTSLSKDSSSSTSSRTLQPSSKSLSRDSSSTSSSRTFQLSSTSLSRDSSSTSFSRTFQPSRTSPSPSSNTRVFLHPNTSFPSIYTSSSGSSSFFDHSSNTSTLTGLLSVTITSKEMKPDISKRGSVLPQTGTDASKIIASNRSPASQLIFCEEGYSWDDLKHVCVQMKVSCPKRFILHPDTKRCVPIMVPDIPCSRGFYFNQFKNQCIDTDECASPGTCVERSERCVNTEGSFSCQCKDGFRRNKMHKCEDIDECANTNICPDDKKCKNIVGSFRCVRAIPCGFGWKEDVETNECTDVDECEVFPDICGYGMKCVNIRGSHKCEDEDCPNNMRRNNKGKCSNCRDGFKINNKTLACEDIDECVEKAQLYKGRCKETEKCVNLPGSYECIPKKKCRPGTILSNNGNICEDVDECKEKTFRCSSDDICINTHSSYQCVASPCAPSQNYDYATQTCVCKEGYRPNSDNICEDIDECADFGANGQCGSMFLCVNKPGGYICINRVDCPKGMYRPSMDSLCQDIDECETGEGKCALNMHCVNMVGSYKCMCDRGFIFINNGSCADINECLLFRPEETCPDLEARCVNTPGSYKCQCPKGFAWSDYPLKKCIDMDECKIGSNPCGDPHICVNIIGSYKCHCHAGYRLTIAGDGCEDINECILLPKKCTNGKCINIAGRYNCQCPKGFLSDSHEICQDVDECVSFKGMCSSKNEFSTRCINLFGYYKCVNNSCPVEYTQLQMGSGFTCMLNQEHHCDLHNTGCLLARPYRRSFEYIELQTLQDLPRTLTRVNVGHLPPGNSRINLQVKYAHHTETKEPISIKNVFQLSRVRHRQEEIDVVLKYSIPSPAEVLLYLQVSVYHGTLYLGHSESFINLYVTKYPDI